ncbi:4-aminobutyrate transaminase [Plasmopara halstedii]|uniref:4-aminobutyrate transaminase n=1 Tax=Plasmopara halstedii TaxID=4781 RepID=A0A0P1AB24_PLAHL|nr:4-aminobutyrate transaminase [Plasmopara halstedii]CEG37783.1 4-aminobutyrate transaminase [Plasmopara halstedii]|eukprot:XP_024574152.1 4-aminobutyrate transaminase [Plasmopara halstedii]
MVKHHLAKGIGRMSDMIMTKGKGTWIWTSDNRKLLDFTSGIAVTSVGHSHPKVVAAVQKQAATLVHAQVNIGYHQPMLDLIKTLLPVLPKTLDSLFFACSGSEAVENAVKLARHATGKTQVIAFQGGYHGRTVGTMSLTSSKTVYSAGFGPLMPGVTFVPYPYALHGPIHDDEKNVKWCLEQLHLALKQQSAPRDTAAIIIEPVLGEGGYVVPPKSFMKGLREVASANDILLIADEIQSGFGRTGGYFAIDSHFDVQPDILTFAKGIADGYPISGIASRKELTDLQPPGSMGGTYAGNAVACAAAIATQQVIADEKLLENTHVRGAQLQTGLKQLKASGKYPILDVRGLGLMIGLEFDPSSRIKGAASKVSAACLNRGMMLLTTSVYETLRFMPPLNVSEDECNLALEIFEKALNDVFKQ